MLLSGAAKVYYIQTIENSIYNAFSEVFMNLAVNIPVICESPSLINHLTPGLFVLMTTTNGINLKNTEELKRHPHLEFNYDEVVKTKVLPVGFIDGCWKSLNQPAITVLP